MVGFLYYYYNAHTANLIYLSTLLTLTSYYPITSVLSLSLLDLLQAAFEWHSSFKNQNALEFTISWEHRRESTQYKIIMILVYAAVLCPYLVLWLFSATLENTCIGISNLIYVLLMVAITFQRIIGYDGPVHKGLKSHKAPKTVVITPTPFDNTDYVLSSLYTILYLIKEEEQHGNDLFSIQSYAQNPKYTHLPWRLIKHLSSFDVKLLRDYLIFPDEESNKTK